VLRLGVALRRYWTARYRDEEALALLRPALNRPDARADPELFGAALVTAAFAARRVDMALALRLGDQAVTLARQLQAGRLLIESLATLNYVCYFTGEPERGLPFGQEAVERARQLGDDVLLGQSLTGYVMCDRLIDPAHAAPLFTEAIGCTQRSGDHLYARFLYNNAGGHALRAGDIPAARAHLNQAAQAMRAIGDENPALSLNMGWVLREDNDPGGARSSTAPRKPPSTRPGNRGSIWKRATARTASARCAPTSARSSPGEPTPRAWRSASTRPSTWPPERPAQPDLLPGHERSLCALSVANPL